ncbi:hypothetical protein ACFJIX_05845 [Roseateles sp. UC29_93]|uniref:hypothetical protein n=1 Tax=Roseateles sp. UC29_93 TaxID=3350177 RepID=UPI00366DF7DC
MLVSHARIRGQRDSSTFALHKGAKRHLLIWDESLITADVQVLTWLDVKSAVERLLPELHDSCLAHWLRDALLAMQADLDAQRMGVKPQPIDLRGSLDLDEIQALACQLRSGGSPLRVAAVKAVRQLTKLATHPISMALTGNGMSGDGLIRYTVAVPAELDNIAVLDASYPIRELTHNHAILDGTTSAMRTCKRYDRVSVRQLCLATGRTTLQTHPDRLKEMVSALAASVADIPMDEAILIFTFKGDDDATLLAKVRRELGERGVDLEARLFNGRARINWLTWGNETSLSEYSHCQHILLGGVLRRSPLDLSASAAGREDDLCYRPTSEQLRAIQLSEVAHCVLQAMNRGSCRNVDEDGMAHAMSLTVLADIKGLHEALAESLPGIVWKIVPDLKLGPLTQSLSARIKAHLLTQPASVNRLSIRSIKAGVAVPADRQTWRDALTFALVFVRLQDPSQTWQRAGQSVIRSIR